MNKVIIITGGDIGDIEKNIDIVKEYVTQFIGNITAASKVYKSSAWGFESNTTFLNQVLIVDTEKSPHEVLKNIWHIETIMGKGHEEYFDLQGMKIKQDKSVIGNYKSRFMDIDILFYDDIVIDDEYLTIPHPMLDKRSFVLEPLYELIPEYIHPTLDLTIKELYLRFKLLF